MTKTDVAIPPPHPGRLLEQHCLTPNQININDAARRLGVARQAVSKILNGRSRLSLDMAMRLEREFGKPAAFWLGAQSAHDLWAATLVRRSPSQATTKTGKGAK